MLDIALRISRTPAASCRKSAPSAPPKGGLDVVGGPRSPEAVRRRAQRAPASGCRCSSSLRRKRLRPRRSTRRAGRRACTPAPGATRWRRAKPRSAPLTNSNACAPPPRQTAALGLECHAGHGLDFDTARTIAALPEIVELNIGHFLIGEAIFVGLADSREGDAHGDGRGARACRLSGDDRRHRQRPLRHQAHRGDARAVRRAFLARCFTEIEQRRSDRRAEPRRLLRQALRGQGGLRQGARHRT